jgi:hypothetical protein
VKCAGGGIRPWNLRGQVAHDLPMGKRT